MHRQRLAWDGARTVVRALGSARVTEWLGGQFAGVLGAGYRTALRESADRMWTSTRPDAPQVESGLWRARLDDLLEARPDLAGPLRSVFDATAVRLERAADLRPFTPASPPAVPALIDLDRHRPA
jgi:hypothetical protein